jgi:Na+/proline symporter
VLLYVLAQLAIGLWVARRVRDDDDYLLAGRTLGTGLALFSLFATWFGAESCIGTAGAVYAGGLGGGRADPLGYALCLLLMGALFATVLRRTGAVTLADAMRARFSPAVSALTVLMTVPASVLWAAAQIRALGQVLATLAPVGLEVTVTVAAAVVLLYTVSGGLRADVVTDLVQGVALLLGLVLLAGAVVTAAGGPGAALAAVPRGHWAVAAADGGSWAARLEPWLVPVIGSVTAQELAARVLAARTPAVARRASLGAGALYLVAGLLPVAVGLVGAGLMPGLADPEQLLPRLAQVHLHPVVAVMLVGALLSAILSTVDSNLLAAGSLIAHDGVLQLRPEPDARRRLRVTRAMTVLAGLAAYALAMSRDGVYALVEESSAFGGAGLFVAMVFGLRSRFGGAAAGTAAVATGIVAQLAGRYALGLAAPFTLSLALATAAYVLVAWRERRRPVPQVVD